MKKPFFSVYIPVFNKGNYIKSAIISVLQQTFTDFELIVRENVSSDNTYSQAMAIKDPRLVVYRNKKYIRYYANLNCGLKDSHGKYIFMMSGDDILDRNTLMWYYNIIKKYPKVGAITRPYYWFEDDYRKPVRIKKTITASNHLLITPKSPFSHISLMLSSVDQVSALCFRKDYIKIKFSPEDWISHAYPFLDIFKNHPIAFIKPYPLAVRIGLSGTRSNIYQKSPIQAWKNMVDQIFKESKFSKIRKKILSNFVASNYVGLVQIKSYGSFYSYFREVLYMINLNYWNLFKPSFIFMFAITLFTPPFLLRYLNDTFKRYFYSRTISRDVIIDFS